MHWLALLGACLLLAVQCWVSFDPAWRRSSWLYPVIVASSAGTSALWAMAARWLDDNERIYVLSIFWETAVILIWFFLPVLTFHVTMPTWSIAVVTVLAVGLILLQVASGK